MTKSRNYYETFNADISELVGKTLSEIEGGLGSTMISFSATDGSAYQMLYYADCCASCEIEEIHGDMNDLIGTPILHAEEVCSQEPTDEIKAAREAEEERKKAEEGECYYSYHADSETWTFYKISTIKGSVTIRWYGSSNGYYSERATFEQVRLAEGETEVQ